MAHRPHDGAPKRAHRADGRRRDARRRRSELVLPVEHAQWYHGSRSVDVSVPGQWEPRQARPLRRLDLNNFAVTTFGLDATNEAVAPVAVNAGSFKRTVVRT